MNGQADHTSGSGFAMCLIHAGAIGDFVLALTVVNSLREHARSVADGPESVVEILGNRATASLALGRGGVDSVTSQDDVRLHTMFAEGDVVDESCVSYFGRFAVIVNMYASRDSTFARQLSEIASARIITIDPAPSCRTRHVTDGWLEQLSRAGIVGPTTPPRLSFVDEERGNGRIELMGHAGDVGGALVVIHPGSGGRAKCWPVDSFIELAEGIAGEGGQPVFMLGPVEQDLGGDALEPRLSAVAPVVVESDLTFAAMMIAGADAYVGNDAGMTHVAAAAGTPTVAIFGPTDPVVWRPLGDEVTVIAGDPPGSFDGVSVEAVIDAIRESMT